MSNRIDWRAIDEHEFVHLCADLLRRVGFTNIRIHGDGPDGGLDILATELIPFAIQGPHSFPWGVQCKFSRDGAKRAVNAEDVHDVAGIVGSARYSTYDLQGYMLITNKRVSQNIVERLAGVDKRYPIKTAYIDGTRLQQMFREYPDVVERAFGEIARATRSYGEPKIVVSADQHSRFAVAAKFDLAGTLVEQRALIDTGASISCIPKSAVEGLNPIRSAPIKITIPGGSTRSLETVLADVHLGDFVVRAVVCAVVELEDAIVGNDVLQRLIVLVDGPSRELRLYLPSESGEYKPLSSALLPSDPSP